MSEFKNEMIDFGKLHVLSLVKVEPDCYSFTDFSGRKTFVDGDDVTVSCPSYSFSTRCNPEMKALFAEMAESEKLIFVDDESPRNIYFVDDNFWKTFGASVKSVPEEVLETPSEERAILLALTLEAFPVKGFVDADVCGNCHKMKWFTPCGTKGKMALG